MERKTVHQHFIPRSYLKNFGYLVSSYTRPSGKVDNKWSIHNIESGGDIKHNSTKKICTVDSLYDLPFADEEYKQIIERGYGEQVDRFFPEVTEFISDEKNKVLSVDMRQKILKCGLSLYFRTPRHIELSDLDIDDIRVLPKSKREQEYNIRKTKLLEKHISNFEKLYDLKSECGICVNTAVGEWEFISGDNPVIFRDRSQESEVVFSEHSLIHIPFTPKYCITIIPNSESGDIGGYTRFDYDDDFVMGVNHDIEKFHDQYIFGSEKALQDYVSEVPAYKAPVSENHPKVVGIKTRLSAWMHVLKIVEQYGLGSMQHKLIFMNYWERLPQFRSDSNVAKHKEEMGF